MFDVDVEFEKAFFFKMFLTLEELYFVEKVFYDDVRERIFFLKKRVVVLMKIDNVLRKVVNLDVKVKKVFDRVRYLVNF